MARKCILCDEEFGFMQLHSSAGTITKDSGCSMYEELLLAKQQLPGAKDKYDELVADIQNKVYTEDSSNHYEEITKQRLLVRKLETRIEFIENDYLKVFCHSNKPELVERRAKIERRVLT